MERNKLFDPTQSFFSLKVVRITFTFAGSIILLSLCSVIVCTDLKFNFSHEGWNNTLTYFKFPIWMAAALIPVITVLAVNHKSHQHVHMMELTRDQNNFANYYKHIEEFLKFMNQFDIYGDFLLRERKLHRLLFPNARTGDFSVNDALIKKIASRFNSLYELSDYRNEFLESDPDRELIFEGEWTSVKEILIAIREELIEYINPQKKPELTWYWMSSHSNLDLIWRPFFRELFLIDYRLLKAVSHAVSFDPSYDSPLIEVEEKFDKYLTYAEASGDASS